MFAPPLDNATNFTIGETFPSANTTCAAPTPFDLAAENLASILNLYYTPVIILLGSIGNLVSISVFYKSKLRLQSTSQYLTALAVSDTIFLLQLLPPWLNSVHITDLFHREVFCQVFVYISYVTCSFSAWLVVAFTIERFVAVLYPLRRNVVCTVKRARCIIVIIAVGALLLNIPVLRFAIPMKNDCNVDYNYLVQAARFNFVDTIVSFTVPLVVIIILNVWIIIGVCRLERERKQLMKENILDVENGVYQRRQLKCSMSQQRVTRMLLIVSSAFVCFNFPAYVMRVIAYAYGTSANESGGRWAAFQQMALMFFNTNFGINFILYCLSGQNFRRALRNHFSCFRERNLRSMTIERPAAQNGSASTSFVRVERNNNAAPANRRQPSYYITRWRFDNERLQRQVMFNRGNGEIVALQRARRAQAYQSVHEPPRFLRNRN